MRRRFKNRLHIPWWGPIAFGVIVFLCGLLILCLVMIGVVLIKGPANPPAWMGWTLLGPGGLLFVAGIPPMLHRGITTSIKTIRHYTEREWVSSPDLRKVEKL